MAEDMKAQVTVSIEDKLSQPLKDMVKVVELMDKSVRAMGDQFGSLADTLLNAAGEFTALLTPIQDAEDSVSALGDTMHGLCIHIKDVEDRLKASENAYGKAERRIDKLEAQIAELSAAMQNLTESHEQANNRIQELTEQMEGMREEQERVAKAAREAEEAQRSFQARLEAVGQAGEDMQKVGASLMAISAGIVGAGTKAVQAYASVESSVSAFKNTFNASKNPGGSDSQLKEAVGLAERLGVSLPGSTEDMLRMFTALRQQGVPLRNIINGIGEATANFATLFGQSFESAAAMMPKFTEALGVDENKATYLVDVLQRLQGVSGLTTDDLYQTFKYVGPALKNMGIQGEQSAKGLSAVLAIMANSGIEGSQAGTNFAGALSHIAKYDPAAISKKVLLATKGKHAFTLDLFDKNGKFIGLQHMLRELQKLRVLGDQDLMNVLHDLFGEQGARPMAALVKAGIDKYTEMNYRMDNQIGTKEKVANIMDTINMKYESLCGTYSTLVSKVGEHLVKVVPIKKILDKINDLLADITAWIDKNPEHVDEIIKKALILTGVLGAAGTITTSVGTALASTAAAVTAWKASKGHITALKDILTGGLNRVGTKLGGVTDALGSFAKSAASTAAAPFTYAMRLFMETFRCAGSWTLTSLSRWVASLGSWFSRSVVSGISGLMVSLRHAAARGIRSLAVYVMNSPLMDVFRNIAGSLSGWVRPFLSAASRFMLPIKSAAARGIVSLAVYLAPHLDSLARFAARHVSGWGRLIGTALTRWRILRFITPLLRLNWVGIALTVIFELIRRHWTLIRDFFKGFGEGFMSGWDKVVEAGKAVVTAFEPLIPILEEAFGNIMYAVNQTLDWLLGTTTEDASPESFANGFGLGATFAKLLELVLTIIENVGYLAKAVADTFADIGKNLAMSYSWLEKVYRKVLTICQKWGWFTGIYNPDNNFGGDVLNRLNGETLDADELNKLATETSRAAQRQGHLDREKMNNLMQTTFAQPAKPTVNNNDYSKTSYTFNVTTPEFDRAKLEKYLRQADREKERKTWTGAKPAYGK